MLKINRYLFLPLLLASAVVASLFFVSTANALEVTVQYTDAKKSSISVKGSIFGKNPAAGSTFYKDGRSDIGLGTINYLSDKKQIDEGQPHSEKCTFEIQTTKNNAYKGTLALRECGASVKDANKKEIEKIFGQGYLRGDEKTINVTIAKSNEELRSEEMARDKALYTDALRKSPDVTTKFCDYMTDRSECSNDLGAFFSQCFDAHVKSNEFTYPDYDLKILASCLAGKPNKYDASKVNTYQTALQTVDAEARDNKEEKPVVSGDSDSDDKGNTEEGYASSCAVEGIGWILCPVVNAMSGMTDGMFDLVAGLMKVSPLGFNQDDPLYKAWSVMRNIANVAFVIAFIFIIFSQLTGSGITNYGVKKMLPRIIIAAILVNVSYFICALAVDLSNIVGVSLQQILVNTANTIGATDNPDNSEWGSIVASILSLGALGGAATVIVAATTTLSIWSMLAGLLPLLVGALFAIMIAFIVLIARQAFIIMLIVIAPLAFVAFLLPNTEGLFKKWKDFFVTLLVLFPMMALIFGGSILASTVMRAGALAENGAIGFFIYLGSIAVLSIPFFITPLLIKFSSGVLNRFAGMINNPNKGPFDTMRKGAERVGKNARNRSYLNKLEGGKRMGFGARRRARIDAIGSGLESEVKRGAASYVADEVQGNQKFAGAIAGGSNRTEAVIRAQAAATSTVDKLKADELSSAEVLIKDANLTQDQMRTLSVGGKVEMDIKDSSGKITGTRTLDAGSSTLLQMAGISQTVKTNDVVGINQLVDNSAVRNSAELRSTLADALEGSSGRPKYLSMGTIAGLRQDPGAQGSAGNLEAIVKSAVEANTYSPEALASADKDELARVAQTVQGNTSISIKHKDQIVNNAKQVLADDRLKTAVSKNKDAIDKISGL